MIGNEPPTAVDDRVAGSLSDPVNANLLANDTDDGGIDADSLAITRAPLYGSVSIRAPLLPDNRSTRVKNALSSKFPFSAKMLAPKVAASLSPDSS